MTEIMNEKLILRLEKLVVWLVLIRDDISFSIGLAIGGYAVFYITGERLVFWVALGVSAGFLLVVLPVRLCRAIRPRRRRIKSTKNTKRREA